MKHRALICYLFLIAASLRGYTQDAPSYIEFVENKGQWDSRANFRGEINNGAFYLERNGFRVFLLSEADMTKLTSSHHGEGSGGAGGAGGSGGGNPTKGPELKAAASTGSTASSGKGGGSAGSDTSDMLVHSHAYNVSFIGAQDQVSIIPDKELPGINNYFIGRDPAHWGTHCRSYQGVTYRNIYPNIDIRYYTEAGQLKYELIVHPGGDPNQIAMLYEGANKLSIKKGQLLVSTSVGTVTELAPVSYLFNDKGRVPVESKYVISGGNTVRFKISGYDPGSTLIIDPTLVFCSFTGSKANNWGFTATPGSDGSMFVGGIVFGSGQPWTTGALQPVFGGGSFDVGIMRFNTTGRNKIYATYIGGKDSETPHSMIADAAGNLVVLGRTYSMDFPYKTAVGPGGAADMYVVRLDPTGSVMLGGLRIGGTGNDCVNMSDQVRSGSERADTLVRNYGDDSRSEVVLDGAGNILVGASTQSAGSFPIVGNVFQANYGGGRQDGVVLKIDPTCDHIIWSSYLGGSGSDAVFVLKTSPATGDIYVAGASSSSNLPGDKSGVLQGAYGGGVCDGFVSIISTDGSVLRKTSYFGTNQADAIYGVQMDKQGFPYIMGTTNGTWTVTSNVGFINPGAKQFVGKLNPDLSSYIYSTTFGTPNARLPNISPVAFLVDRCENVYISGWGGWIISGQTDRYGLMGTTGMPVTGDAIKKLTDNRDFYFIVLKKNVSALLYGTFYGQDDNSRSISEHVDGGTSRYDQNGIIYQAICANCSGGTAKPFPTTMGVWSVSNGASPSGCNLAALKIAFNFSGVAAGLKASVNGRDNDTSGCVPLDAVFQDTVRNAVFYIWNYGDGTADTTSTAYAVTHTYPIPGKYRVMMVAVDSNSCNIRDTTYRWVIGRTDKADLSWIYSKVGADCHSLTYQFQNTSVAPGTRLFTDQSFVWTFSDLPGQRIPDAPLGQPLTRNFTTAGSYTVRLVLQDTGYCNYPDSLTQTVRVSPMTVAKFETPATGCAPYTAIFDNTSLGGTSFYWDFGDGQTSTEAVPVHVYANPGPYTITLKVDDPSTCNKTDQTSQTITVSGRPTAGFSFGPSPPVANTPIVFTNGSTGGTQFVWHFGDVDSLVRNNMDTVQHQYVSTDTFTVCLVAINQYGCTDTICKAVPTLVHPLLDVPNAFTPGRFGQNAVVKVLGFGIIKLNWRIYNRWGQLVFQSDDPGIGWDGTYQGKLQPQDVYAYTLEAEFSNGAHVRKKGDITLVR